MVMHYTRQELSDDDTLLRRLRIFKVVVDAGGVGEAARELGLSQPAVSAQILRLEDYLGIALFRRTGRRLVVTEQGRQIADMLHSSLGEIARMLNAVRDVSRSQTAELRFGFSAPQIALDAADAFRRADPHTKLELRAANSSELFTALDLFELDVIMIGLPEPKATYHCQYFRSQCLGILVPETHALAERASVLLRDLLAEPLVLREHGSYTRALLLKTFDESALVPRVAFEVATREAVAEAVRRGFGVGPVLDQEAPQASDLRFIPLEGGRVEATEFLVCRAGASRFGPVKRFFAANETDQP